MRDRDMMTKGILAALLLFITPVLMAQNTTSGLTVQTTPPGAEVEVAGALTVSIETSKIEKINFLHIIFLL